MLFAPILLVPKLSGSRFRVQGSKVIAEFSIIKLPIAYSANKINLSSLTLTGLFSIILLFNQKYCNFNMLLNMSKERAPWFK